MKVCLATTEILGAHRNGGIGTATSHLALLLAHGGHDVTLLNASDDRLEANGLWSSLYRRFGVRVVRLPLETTAVEPWPLRAPAAYCDHLGARDFDVVIFQDWLGLAFSCTLAKKAGLAFKDTCLVVNTHGSMQWVHDVADVAPSSRGKLVQVEIERRAVEQADAVISPSTYLVDWMRAQGWRLPPDTRVLQNFLDGFSLAGLKPAHTPSPERRSHLVYFGRLERRKGVFLFLDALLARPLAERRFTLSFLGREADLGAPAIRRWVLERRPDLMAGLQVHTGKSAEEAMAYLQESRGLAVIPSYSDNSPCVIWECIEAGVPFVSTVNGGIPELIAPEMRERLLVEPKADTLAARLAQALDDPAWPLAAHAEPPERVGRAWLSWLEAKPPEARTQSAAEPLTVVLVDTGEERALRRRLRELILQTDTDFEQVVVSPRAPPRGLQAAVMWITGSQAGLVEALKVGAKAAQGRHLVLATTAGPLSPDLVGSLRAAVHAFPDSAVTAEEIEAADDDASAEAFARRDLSRRVFSGGPLAAGAFDNLFGELPLALPRAALAVDADWLPPSAESGWALLAAWALSGRAVVPLPLALSAKPADGDLLASRERRRREETRVKRLYARALPAALSDLVLCDLD